MKDKKWTFALITLFIAFIYLLTQFVMSTFQIQSLVNQMSGSHVKKSSRVHFIMISQEMDNPFWRMVEKGARKAAAEQNMEMEYIGPLRINLEEQTKMLEKAIASKVDAILLQGVRNPDYTRLIDKAMNSGISVITIDADVPESKRAAYVGTDNVELGKRLGQLVVQHSDKNVALGIIQGSSLAENQRQRLDGFRSVISEYPGIRIIDIRSSNISRIEAAREAEIMLNEHPDINIMVGLSALDGVGIVQAAKNLKRGDLAIFGFDDVEETKQAIRHGDIKASVIQKPYTMGYSSVKLLEQYLRGTKLPDFYFTSIEVLGPHNAGAE